MILKMKVHYKTRVQNWRERFNPFLNLLIFKLKNNRAPIHLQLPYPLIFSLQLRNLLLRNHPWRNRNNVMPTVVVTVTRPFVRRNLWLVSRQIRPIIIIHVWWVNPIIYQIIVLVWSRARRAWKRKRLHAAQIAKQNTCQIVTILLA